MIHFQRKSKTLIPILLLFMLIFTVTFTGNKPISGMNCPHGTFVQSGLSTKAIETTNSSARKYSATVSHSSGKDILLFSYMRSGSTVTGNLLRDSPGVFFMFEPLSPLAPYSYFTDRSICEMRNSTCRSENVKARIEVALEAMVNMYSCNMKEVPISLIDKIVAENKSGKSWEEFGKCLNGTRSGDKSNAEDEMNRLACFDRLEHACRAADYRVAKVLRLGFATIGTLLKRVPNMKVLYLARDPRAIINSRIKTKWFPVFTEKPKTVFTNIRSLCLKMETDIQAWKHVRDVYGDRILHTTLTQIASRVNAMLEIFQFMNKPVTIAEERSIISYIYKNIANNITENWRSELAYVYRTSVEDCCHNVINHVTIMNANTV